MKKVLKFLTVLVLMISQTTYSQSAEAKKSGYAPVNGISMYYEIHGEGDLPLVLIHGGGSTIETTFGEVLPMFAGHGKVIALELQAHGRTTDRDAPESFQQDADDVAALMKFLGIRKANFLGFSNGGSTTMQIAIRHPEIVHKIVAISAVFLREGMVAGFFDFMPTATLESMPQPLKEGYLKVSAGNMKGLQTMFEKDKQRMVTFKDWPDDEIRSIKAPALIVGADRDVTTPEHALRIARLIPNARLLILPGVHGECIGEVCAAKKGSKTPALTIAMIESFLNE